MFVVTLEGLKMRKGWFTIFVVIALLLIPVYFLAPEALFFRQFAGEFSIYGSAVSLVLLLGFFSWMGFFRLRVRSKVSRERFLKHLGNTLVVLGFRRSWPQVAVGLILGACLGMVTWRIDSAPPSNSLGLTGWVVGMGIIMVFFAPLIEETLFRGYLINRCLSSGRGKAWAWALAIAASIFIFSWLHASSPELKILPGAVFTLVYLWGRGNNVTAAIMTHATGNAVILLSAFLPLGTIDSAVALSTVVVAIPLLVFILWTISLPNETFQEKVPQKTS